MGRDQREKPDVEVGSEDFTRRAFLKGASLSVASVGIAGSASRLVAGESSGVVADAPIVGPGKVELGLRVNGRAVKVETEPWMTLLDTLRDSLDLTGTKRVCDRGSCGGCTVLVDGSPVNSCSMLAIDAAGKEIITVEGVAKDGELTGIQKAFVECDALQCGFCTPGMVVACTALLDGNPDPTRAEIAEALAGNICRCGTYQNIFEAVELEAARRKGGRRAEF